MLHRSLLTLLLISCVAACGSGSDGAACRFEPGDRTYADGERWSWDCNECQCDDGDWTCTTRGCVDAGGQDAGPSDGGTGDALDLPDTADATADAPSPDDVGSARDAADAAVETDAGPPWDPFAPWAPPQLDWSTCPTAAGGPTLAEKAAYYDWIVPALHQVPPDVPGHEDFSRVFTVDCDGDVPTTVVPAGELPSCRMRNSDNNGLWTSLYVASQAFRYAATGEPAALDQLRRTLRGTYQMMLVTGTDGLYTRNFMDPAVPGQECSDDPEDYVPMAADMVGNRWVRVGDDGCFLTWDPAAADGAGDWARDGAHCTEPRFAGYCWQRNVSKDEYAGHVFAAGVAAKLVDDPEVRQLATDILAAIGRHLVANDYWLTDYDGRPTRFGSVHALSGDHLPGFNAWLALSWTRTAASVTDSSDIVAAYEDCLLQLSGANRCIDRPLELPRDYRQYLTALGLDFGCQTNYDNVSMATLAALNLVWLEPDPERAAFYRDTFFAATRGPDRDGRDLWSQANPFLDFVLVALMGADPAEPDAATALVEDALCTLHRFPATNIRTAHDTTDEPVWCVSDRHGELAAAPIPIEDRCTSVFEWWGDPNEIQRCDADPRRAQPPAGFLLPYWMGRYFGFVPAEL